MDSRLGQVSSWEQHRSLTFFKKRLFIYLCFIFQIYKLITNGQYQFRVRAVNKYGTSDDCLSEKVVIKDPFGLPGPPGKPKVVDHTRSTMLVTWEPPRDNGGAPISGYWLEKKEEGGVYWSRVNRAPVTKPAMKRLEFNVLRLIEGVPYQFRVMAENIAGIGPPSEPSDLVTAADPICKYITLMKSMTSSI